MDVAYGNLTPIKAQPEAKAARQALIRAKNAIIAAYQELEPDPVPAPVVKRTKGALVVNATACVPAWFFQAGITHVAFDLTAENMADAKHRTGSERWAGFTLGGMFISRGGDTQNEVNHAATICQDNQLAFLVLDVEAHKVGYPTPGNPGGGKLEWTDNLFAGLRAKLGLGFPLIGVTFGIHQDASVMNHDAFRRHNVKALFEAYEGAHAGNGWVDGATTGVKRTAEHVAAQGWKPAHLALGDKHLVRDVAEFADPAVAALVGDVFVWGPEQAADTILELQKVPA